MKNKPYTYLLTHLPSGMKYYGVRYAKNCDPSDLWKTYFTSSTKIRKIIDRDGADSFSVEIRKTFDTDVEAIKWETTVLRRLGVPNNPSFFNKGKNHPLSQAEKEEAMFREYGVRNAFEAGELRDKATQSIIDRYGVDNVAKSSEIQQKKKDTLQERYGVDWSWDIEGVLEKSKNTRMERYGVEWSLQSEEIKEKSKQRQTEKFGDWRCNTQEVIDIRAASNLEKYGVDNPFKIKGFVENIMIEKYGVSNWFQTDEGKLSITKSWENRELMKCPHCDVESKSYSNMKRWHFDNCKKIDKNTKK